MSSPEITHDLIPLPSSGEARPTRSTSVTNRWIILGLCSGIVLLSLVLKLGDDGHQVKVPLLDQPLPPLCAMKRYTGIDCPGCGLTRSFVSIGHGEFTESLRYNPAGLLWFVIIAGQIPWQALQLYRRSRGQDELLTAWWGQSVFYVGIAALIAQWVLRQLAWL